MSLSSTQAAIEEALLASGRFVQVAIWAGEVQALIDTPKQVPAAFVIMSGVDYDSPIGCKQQSATSDNLWSVVIFEYVSKTAAGEVAAYQAIETTVAALTNLKVTSNLRLWPVRARLLGSVKNSVSGYGVQFSLI